MKKTILAVSISALLVAGYSWAGSGSHWGYEGAEGPEHWGSLDNAYGACATGVNQSPVNLSGFVEGDLPLITYNYTAPATDIINNGHTVQANFPAGGSISIDGMDFNLLQCHFHSPSENTIDGKSFPMEGHCVHATADGKLAVVSIMYEVGAAANPGIAGLWATMPVAAGTKNALSYEVHACNIMPENKDYYRFNGSLTTPPCTEGVRWVVLKDTVSISEDQLEQFVHVMHHPNNRPVQSVNSRIIIQ